MPVFKVYRYLDNDQRLSDLVLTTEARHAPHALLIAGELLCPGDETEQKKLSAQWERG